MVPVGYQRRIAERFLVSNVFKGMMISVVVVHLLISLHNDVVLGATAEFSRSKKGIEWVLDAELYEQALLT